MLKQPRILLAGLSILLGVGAMIATVMILRGVQGVPTTKLLGAIAWCVAPYLLLILVARLAAQSTLSAGLALAGIALTAWFGIDSLYAAFVSHPDAQSGLVVMLLPVVQWVCCGASVAAILFMAFLKWVVLPGRGKVTG